MYVARLTLIQKPEDRPESPTTAKALDFDDEPIDTPASPPKRTSPNTTRQPGSGEDVGPPKPPRPLAPEQQAEYTLKEAFPSIDAAVVKAVLRASGGRVEPAFNALLGRRLTSHSWVTNRFAHEYAGMSDPDAAEPPPPAQPPRPPRASTVPTSTEEDQLAADERYARQLADHYNGAGAYGGPQRYDSGSRPAQSRGPVRRGSVPRPEDLDEDRDRSFFDGTLVCYNVHLTLTEVSDELPIIRDNIKKGFLETQSTVNKWVSNLKKKIDGDDVDEFQGRPAQGGYVPQQQYGGRRSSEFGRRSTDRERYDTDPQVLGDDFSSLQMRDNESMVLPNLLSSPTQADIQSTATALEPASSESGSFQTHPSTPSINSIRPSRFVPRRSTRRD